MKGFIYMMIIIVAIKFILLAYMNLYFKEKETLKCC